MQAALVSQVPLRGNIGKRRLGWKSIGMVTGGLIALQWFDNLHVSFFTIFGAGVMYGNHTAVRNYAIGWGLLSVLERRKRISEEKSGTEPHTWWPGDSRFNLNAFLPFTPRVVAVAIEPGLVFVAGAVTRRLGLSMLPWVLFVSAICLCVTEWTRFHKVKQHSEDLRDIELEGRWQAEMVKNPGQQETRRGADGAIPTGMEGLRKHVRENDDAGEAFV